MKSWLFEEKNKYRTDLFKSHSFLCFRLESSYFGHLISQSLLHIHISIYTLSSFCLDTPTNSWISFIFRTQIKNNFLQEAFPKLLQFPACTAPQAHAYTHTHTHAQISECDVPVYIPFYIPSILHPKWCLPTYVNSAISPVVFLSYQSVIMFMVLHQAPQEETLDISWLLRTLNYVIGPSTVHDIIKAHSSEMGHLRWEADSSVESEKCRFTESV